MAGLALLALVIAAASGCSHASKQNHDKPDAVARNFIRLAQDRQLPAAIALTGGQIRTVLAGVTTTPSTSGNGSTPSTAPDGQPSSVFLTHIDTLIPESATTVSESDTDSTVAVNVKDNPNKVAITLHKSAGNWLVTDIKGPAGYASLN